MEVTSFSTLASPDAAGRREVERVRLESSVLRVSLLSLGASLHTVEAPDRHGSQAPVHLSLARPADYGDRQRNPYLGATVGRYANRIAFSSFDLDGATVHLEPNEGPHHLHGGPEGFARRVWELTEVTATADGGRVQMTLTSIDDEGGYPGTLAASATFTLHQAALTIAYEAVTDAPTVVNLCSHGYWNLGGPRGWVQPGSIGDHELRIAADQVLPAGPDALPTGPLVPVVATAFDLRRSVPLDQVLARHPHGVDHAFALDPGAAGHHPLRPAAELHHPASGRTLTVATDQPALHLYTGNHLAAPFARQAAVCLEAQQFPDAPNRPELGAVVLRPGDRYRSTTELAFSVR